jgi:HSP20 family protein
MAVEVQKAVPIRSIWYFGDDPQNSISENQRWRSSTRSHLWRPPTDLFETEDTLVVRVEIAGMREEDFSIFLENRILTVRGARYEVAERKAFHQMEIPFGEFMTEVELPAGVDSSEVEAVYNDGFLRVVLAKMRPHQVNIESK